MALAFSTLADNPSTVGATSYASSSVTPTGAAGVFVFVLSSGLALATTVTLDTPTWLDGAWTKVEDEDTGLALFAFYGKAIGSPAADTVTADFEADTQTGCHIIIVEATGQDATTLVVQSKVATSGVATSGTVTLDGAMGSANNHHLAIFGHEVNEAHAPAGGETELADNGFDAPTRRMSVQHKANDTSSSASWTTSAEWHAIGLEVKAASAGTTVDLTNAVETDTAQALDIDKAVSLVTATETDSAQALRIPRLTTATETDSAVALDIDKAVTLTPAAETDTAQALSITKTIFVSLTPATETDTAETLTFSQAGAFDITPATETDSAQALTFTKTIFKDLTLAAETNSAQTLSVTKTIFVSLVHVDETDTAQALSIAQAIQMTITAATETDTAVTLSFLGGVPVVVHFDPPSSGSGAFADGTPGSGAFDAHTPSQTVA